MNEFDKIQAFSDNLEGKEIPSIRPIDSVDFDDEEEETKSKFNIHFVALGVIGLFLILAIASFFIFKESDSKEVVVLEATDTPVKVVPENQTANIMNRNSYDEIHTDLVNAKVESLFPAPETPVVPENLADPVLAIDELAEIDTIETKDPLALKEEAPIDIANNADLVELPGVEEIKTIEPIVVKEVAPLKETTAKTKTAKSAKAVAAKGKWAVQLMSSTQKSKTESSWVRLSKKHKSLLSNLSHKVVKANIAGKGTFYRLWVGSFATKDQAGALCKKLKAAKQDCLVVQ